MQKPTSVKYAEVLIWLTLAVSVVVVLAERQMGIVTTGILLGSLFLYAIYAVLPYQISRGRNWARIVYAALSVFGYGLMLIGQMDTMPRIEVIASWIELPFSLASLYLLFKPSSSAWFQGKPD